MYVCVYVYAWERKGERNERAMREYTESNKAHTHTHAHHTRACTWYEAEYTCDSCDLV